MTVMSLLPPVTDAAEEYVGGYGHVPSKFMVVIPEAPLSATGIMPTTETQMGMFRQFVQLIWKEAYITPLVKYRRSAKAKTLYAKEIRYWLPVLYEEIRLINPERILVMGKFAAKYLIPNFKSMKNDHGSLFTVPGEHLSPRLEDHKFIMVPTFTFQDVVRDPMSKRYFGRDLQRFTEVKVTVPNWTVLDSIASTPLPRGLEVTIDTETTGLDLTSRITMIGVGYEISGEEYLFISHDPRPDSLAELFSRINERGCSVCFHNSTFDWAQLINNANGKMPKLRKRINDTMVNAHLSGEHIRNLKHLTSFHTDLPGPHSGGSFEDEQYLAEDVRSTRALTSVPEINLAKGTYADHLYSDLAPILVDMRLRGVYMNRDRLMELSATTQQKLHETTKSLHELTSGDDINWNSAGQVSEKLLECGIPLSTRTEAGALSVSEPVLNELKTELEMFPDQYEVQLLIIDTLLRYRSEAKLVSGFFNSYLELLDEVSLLYPNLKLLGTKTGRLSCSDPNLQQIPRKGDFKLCFEPRWCNPYYTTAFAPGYYGLVDFAGAELKMAAIISGDRQMAEFILAGDPHCFMARLAFPQRIPKDATDKEIKTQFAGLRKASKKTTFGKMYDGTNKGLATKNDLPIEDIESVERALHENCPDLMKWVDKTKRESKRTLMTGTMFGNKRNLLDKKLYEGDSSVARAGLNTPIQGGSGILALVVLRKLHRLSVERNLVSRPIFGVHDSILSEVAEHEIEEYAQATKDAYRDIENSPIVEYPVYHMLGITGDLEIGRNWANVEETNEVHTNILHSIPCSSQG